MYTNLGKYKFFILEVEFLGFVVGKNSIYIDF